MDFLKKTKIANHFIFIIVELFSILVALRPRGLRMWPHQSHCSPDQQGQKGPFALAADSTLDFGRPPTSLPVWPDDKIKSSQLFSNVAQKIAAVVFPEKSSSSHQIFWLFLWEKFSLRPLKTAKSGGTTYTYCGSLKVYFAWQVYMPQKLQLTYLSCSCPLDWNDQAWWTFLLRFAPKCNP